MNVKDIMHAPTFVDPGTSVADAAKIMVRKNVSSLLVGTPKDVIGMFTERDMLREVIINGLDSKKISLVDIMCSTELKSVMCRVLTTINWNEPVEEAAERMMGRYVRHLPVSNDDGEIVGMVSARTVMNALRRRVASSFRRK
ncbi:MAG TPA: CBS domain-containing protein [Euryarchaeota archaeon]|nr:inosine 5'-monophosphate dehydrogenase [archaeon BMS3Bbin15]HDL15019.1 CBS domain-containing protein [Euryarchaeota archaeon]